MGKDIRKMIDKIESFKQLVNEDIINKRTKSNVWYHGSSSPKLTIDNIKINDNSPEMFYGNGFYVASDINLARKYGKNIYEVEFDGNFYEVKSREILGTYGTFEQYLDTILDSYKENILDNIKENPKYWLGKLKIEKQEFVDLYNNSDSDILANYYIENNKYSLFQEYIENQQSLRDEYEEDGYDGLIDITQAVIFNPQKSVKKLFLLK
jgi:hypothetical protein